MKYKWGIDGQGQKKEPARFPGTEGELIGDLILTDVMVGEGVGQKEGVRAELSYSFVVQLRLSHDSQPG